MNDIRTRVRNAGVVGAGGAGFPTHIKLSSRADIVIVNGAECEPLLKTDQQLAALYPEILVKGLAYAMEAVGAGEGIIALKAKYKQAIAAIEPHLMPGMRIGILRDIYPAGDEAITIWMTTGRRVPPGGIPLDIGVVVNNVQTVLNIARAMAGEAVTTRTLTITGAVLAPVTVTVPIGTPFSELLKLAGGGSQNNLAYIDGGPVMGSVLPDLSQPVTKTSGGLIALPIDHPLIQSKSRLIGRNLQMARTVCEQCSMCTELCPRHIIGHRLSPHLIVRSINYSSIGTPEILTGALLCSECGVCEVYACPVGISPRRINAALKKEMRVRGIKYEGQLGREDIMAENRLIPSSRMAARLGLLPWYREAPLSQELYQPDKAVIKLQQHIGQPAVPVVQENDRVKKGAVIAEIPEGALGARIHASMDGIVSSITPQSITIRKDGGNE